ncbi:unnamed protein product [Mytilus coruscus]|uniref:PiggyBac transposable element-derived protein domain-containing protein n=1 Tax=Mytilus coruscus TaxID=42192 RepID=A0A6J7ZYE2_MYTCO|nr:unnamed protein product [Mytilus coruscus]
MVASKHKYSGIRQFIKDKPIRFGIKLWVLACSVTGFTWNFFVYLGKKRTNIVDKSKGLAYAVVTTLCEKLYGQGFRLYVDSFYTTLHLANDLLTNKVYLMGAVRSNSTAMPQVFKQSVDWSKLVSRGDFRWHREGSFVFIQWKDCKTVTLMSPLHKSSDVTFGQVGFRESIASELMNIGRSSVEDIVTKHMPSFLSNRKDCVYCNAKGSMDGLPSPSHKIFSFCNTCLVPT